MNFLTRYAPIWLTAGLVVWLEGMATVEWTYPYCLDRSDGPAYAAQGMPLPYWMWNGVSSLEHDFVPHVYILNTILLCVLMYPVVRWVLDRAVSRTWFRSLFGAFGSILLLSHIALTVLMISVGYFRPTTTLTLDGYYRYTDFRPVRIGFNRSNAPDCTPSPFWFPNGWQHE